MSTSAKKPREIKQIDPSEALDTLKSAVSYLMQSGLNVQAGTVHGDTLVIRITGAKVANYGDGIIFVPSSEIAPDSEGVPSKNQVRILPDSQNVPAIVPAIEAPSVEPEKSPIIQP